MASVSVILRTKKETGRLTFRIRDGRGVQLSYVSDIEVKASLWDARNRRIKAKALCPESYRRDINSRVRAAEELIERVYAENKGEIRESADLKRLIERELHPEEADSDLKPTFFEAFNRFLSEHDISEREKKNYRTLERTLHRYQGYKAATARGFTLDYDTTTADNLNDFFRYCREEADLIHRDKANERLFARLLKEYPLLPGIKRETHQVERRGGNTVIKMKQRYKCFWGWLMKKRLTRNDPFGEITIGSAKYGTPYYITAEERDLIAGFDLSARPTLERQRDIFIFQCLIGCRVGDLLEMKGTNVVGDEVHYIPHKTCRNRPETLKVPLHERAAAIVRKYGRAGTERPLLPFVSAQKYNKAIKEIFTLCGITRNVAVLDPKTGEQVLRPINELASSHMARRTFVGALYRKVKDPNLIGKLSGHSENSRAFARYREIDEEMKRELIDML